MTTINSVGVSLSGQSGIGSFVGSTRPTLTTPTLGAAIATSITFSPTTGGIVGTTTNDSVTAGDVGEYVSSTVAFASSTSISTTTATNLTSISLTAGDWDVWGNITFVPASTTTVNSWQAAINTATGTMPDPSLRQSIVVPATTVPGSGAILSANAPMQRLSLSGTTTVYVIGFASFGVSTMTQCGYISARRRR